MKELAAILRARATTAGQPAIIATLVNATGSTYRRPGARMLILPDETTVGSISGGCLERDVIERSRNVAESGRAIVLSYDTTSEEDIVFGAGLGCKGTIEILVEPLQTSGSPAALIAFIQSLFERRQSGVAATVFRVSGRVEARIGDRLMLDPTGDVMGEIRDESLREKMLSAARDALASGRSKTLEFELTDGVAAVFVEVIQAPVPLIIFGAGYDAVPMVRLAAEIGFQTTIVDVRPAYATAERFPEANSVVVARPEEVGRLGLTDRAVAVIMSHNYLVDRALLQALLPLNLRYLGLMGPRARAQKMLAELRHNAFEPGEAALGRLHNPVGLDIGAESPEQIALAILAEIQAVLSGHAGGLLREKKGPIHSPTPPA